MEYIDDKITELKKELRYQKYTDIKGQGIFINGEFIKFSLRTVADKIELYIPEEFIDMPEEIQLLKFPSVNRPQTILTSLDGSINFAFNIIKNQNLGNQMVSLTEQMKEMIRKSNPSAVFYQEYLEYLANSQPIFMFDFKSFGVDAQMYNMVCFTSLDCGTLHGTFICLDQDSEDWKDMAWEAFKTIREINVNP